MNLDIVFPLIDIDDNPSKDWYFSAATMMVASAKRAFRNHDIRLVQLTDEASRLIPGTDYRFECSPKVTWQGLAQYRGHSAAEWALQTDRPAVICDVDLLWNNDAITLVLEHGTDLVLTRRALSIQPFNGGLILTQPNQTKWWSTYKQMMKELPNDIKPWWGDQIGLAVMMGVPDENQNGAVKFGSRVAYLPVDLLAPSPKSQPTQISATPATHFKGGKRKPWMADYFQMLMATQPIVPQHEEA